MRGYLSKKFYVGSILGVGILGTIFVGTEAAFLVDLGLLSLIYTGIVFLVVWYKAWAAIQDGHARATPGKAIGFLFIPFFGFYWIFQAFWGFARDYNSYVERNRLLVSKLSSGLFLAFSFLHLVAIVIGAALRRGVVADPWEVVGSMLLITYFVVGVLIVSKVCSAVNALVHTKNVRA